MATIRFKTFAIVVADDQEESFIDELEALCKKFAGEAYHFLFYVDGIYEKI